MTRFSVFPTPGCWMNWPSKRELCRLAEILMPPSSKSKKPDALSVQAERRILHVRGQKVLLDYDLAELYGVETRALKQAVRRNRDRFPSDFLFELSDGEIDDMVSQNVIPGRGKLGGASPLAFTEQGVAMLSSVLRSSRALQVNIGIMRAFVHLRELLLSNAALADKLNAMEKQYDAQFRVVFDAIRMLMAPPPPDPDPPREEIGFHVREDAPAFGSKSKKRAAKR